MSTHQVWIFDFLVLAGLSESMDTICTVGWSLAFEVLRCDRLLSSRTAIDTH